MGTTTRSRAAARPARRLADRVGVRGGARLRGDPSPRWRAVVLGAGVVICGSSCGRDDILGASELAAAIEHELSLQGVFASVACPRGAAAGDEPVACTAISSDDPSGQAALVVRAHVEAHPGGAPRVRVTPEAALAIDRAGPAIARALAERGIEAERIDCDGTLARPGDRLRCDIDAKDGPPLRWTAVLGPDGHARGELHVR